MNGLMQTKKPWRISERNLPVPSGFKDDMRDLCRALILRKEKIYENEFLRQRNLAEEDWGLGFKPPCRQIFCVEEGDFFFFNTFFKMPRASRYSSKQTESGMLANSFVSCPCGLGIASLQKSLCSSNHKPRQNYTAIEYALVLDTHIWFDWCFHVQPERQDQRIKQGCVSCKKLAPISQVMSIYSIGDGGGGWWEWKMEREDFLKGSVDQLTCWAVLQSTKPDGIFWYDEKTESSVVFQQN